MLTELFTLDVLKNFHSSGALEPCVERIRGETACAKTSYLILELLIRPDSLPEVQRCVLVVVKLGHRSMDGILSGHKLPSFVRVRIKCKYCVLHLFLLSERLVSGIKPE